MEKLPFSLQALSFKFVTTKLLHFLRLYILNRIIKTIYIIIFVKFVKLKAVRILVLG